MKNQIKDPIIEKLAQLDIDTNREMYQYGVAHVQYDVVKKQFDKELSSITSNIQIKMTEFDNLVKQLKEKYGEGHLDLQKGVFEPNNENNNNDENK